MMVCCNIVVLLYTALTASEISGFGHVFFLESFDFIIGLVLSRTPRTRGLNSEHDDEWSKIYFIIWESHSRVEIRRHINLNINTNITFKTITF